MKKLLLIPRAVIDILSVWNKQLTIREKSSLTYTLSVLKIKKWLCRENAVIGFPLFGYQFYGINNQSLQFLLREIFVDRIYETGNCPGSQAQVTIIDAGSNIGLSVVFFKRHFPNCTIDAYEPNESSFTLLKRNIEQNKIKGVCLKQVAISDNEEDLFAESGFEPASVNQRFSVKEKSGKPIKALRLTNLIQQAVDYIKLDIEGAETWVLKDVIQNKSLKKSYGWLVEFHGEKETKQSIITEFIKNGFACTQKKDVYQFEQSKSND